MNIAPVSPYRNISMRSKDDAQTTAQTAAKIRESIKESGNEKKTEKTVEKSLKYAPVLVGLMNGALWATVGFACDRALSGLFKLGTSLKTSAYVNGAIGIGMGLYSYIQAKKAATELKTELKTEPKTDNTQNA